MNLKEATQKYKWIKEGSDGVCELYCDNMMLSSLRQCEAYFAESILNNIRGNARAWSLEFGQFMHHCLEFFDAFENGSAEDYQVQWLTQCKELWYETYKLEEFADRKQYKSLKGWPGAQLLLMQYHQIYGEGKERLRTVGTELSFGKDKEVPLQDDEYATEESGVRFRAYYTGRLDRIVDNGTTIGPLDRKTTAYFDGSESGDFKPHEGMQGYVYALQHLVNRITKGEAARQGRLCNSIIIDHISLKETKEPYERFKRSVKTYTPQEMERWRLRQLSTFSRLYDIVINERTPDWNTAVCNYMYYHQCPYKTLHEVDELQRPIVLSQFYQITQPWSPYKEDERRQPVSESSVSTLETQTTNP